MEADQKKMKEWSREALACYLDEVKEVGEKNAPSFYNQSDLSRVKECDLMIIGINPGMGCPYSDWSEKNNITSDFLYYGNPCFKGKSNEVVISELFGKYDKDKNIRGWDLIKKMYSILEKAGKGDVLKHLDKFVMSNMIFFGTLKEKFIPNGINKIKCAKQTLNLIEILKPKVILLLGKECRNLFNTVAETKMAAITPDNSVFYCFYNNCHVISIYHTAYFRYYTNENRNIVGKIIGNALDNSLKKISEEEWDSYLAENVKIKAIDLNTKQTLKEKVESGEKLKETELFKVFKAKINPSSSDSCALFYRGKLLNYEFYTKINESKKYVNSKDTIAIDFLIEGGEYIIRVGTRKNDPNKTREIALAIDGEFRPGNTDVTASYWHVHARNNLSTSNDEMVRIVNELLSKVKAYRDKEYPLK